MQSLPYSDQCPSGVIRYRSLVAGPDAKSAVAEG